MSDDATTKDIPSDDPAAPDDGIDMDETTSTDEPTHATTSTTPDTTSTEPTTFEFDGDDLVTVFEDDGDGELMSNPYGATDFQQAADPANPAFEVTQDFPHGTPVLQGITGEEHDSPTFGATTARTWEPEDNEHVVGPPYADQVEPKVAYGIPDPRETGAGLY